MSIMENTTDTAGHALASREQWLGQRRALLAREKELTRMHDQLAQERRALPWVRVEKTYVFDTPAGRRTLAELFQGRRQLLVQHFMLGPGWEAGCPACSYMADHVDGMTAHLAQRDLALVAVSRAPLVEITAFRQRMGWKFPWVSSHGNDFNRDYGVSFSTADRKDGLVDYNYGRLAFPHDEAPGISVFASNDMGEVFHTYSTYGRGLEVMMGAYGLLDLVPRGRDEDGLPFTMAWVRHHDRYPEQAAATDAARAQAGACCASHA